jgi:hypothetical protein
VAAIWADAEPAIAIVATRAVSLRADFLMEGEGVVTAHRRVRR